MSDTKNEIGTAFIGFMGLTYIEHRLPQARSGSKTSYINTLQIAIDIVLHQSLPIHLFGVVHHLLRVSDYLPKEGALLPFPVNQSHTEKEGLMPREER